MPLPAPILVGLGAVIVPKVVEYLTDKPASEDRRRRPRCRATGHMTREQAARFTRVEDGYRVFDPQVGRGLSLLLSSRSAIAEPPSRAAPAARIYRVSPLRAGQRSAEEVIAAAHELGQDVYLTLSAALLPSGREMRTLVVTAPQGHRLELAAPHTQLALLERAPSAPAERPVEARVGEQSRTNGKAAAKPAKTNGALAEDVAVAADRGAPEAAAPKA